MGTSAKTVTPSMSQISNHEYFDHFDGVDEIHKLLKNKNYNQAVSKIKKLCQAAKDVDFPLNRGGYTRNILSKKDGYWLSFLHWDKNVITPVHGHPDQAFLYTADGNIVIKNYEKDENKPIVFKDTMPLAKGEFTYSHGEVDTYDNAIHQISTTEQSLTLHFYSDDPTKGALFNRKKD
jgi:hypothetical protein